MDIGNPMTLRSQLGVGAVGVLGIVLIIWLLHRRRINEGLFYLWLVVFGGIIIVGTSHTLQVSLTRFIGAYDPVSTMLLFALGFLFGASMIYSILISVTNSRIRDLTTYVAEMRLDLDDLQRDSASGEGAPPPASGDQELIQS